MEILKDLLLCIENIEFSVIKKNDTVLLKFLLDNGIDINSTNKEKNTLLHVACENNQIEIIDTLLLYNPDKNKQNDLGNTPFHISVLNNNIDCVKKLSELNINKEIKNKRGKTAFVISIEKNYNIISEYLSSTGFNVLTEDVWGFSVLHHAAKNGNIDLLNKVVSENPLNKHKIINKKDKNGNTPLYVAVYNNQLKFVKEIIKNGANVNSFNYVMKFPVHLAVIKNNIQMLKELCENGANVNVSNKENKNPLKISVLNDNEEIFKYLLEKGSKINEIDKLGRTILHDAYSKGNVNIINIIKNDTNFDKHTQTDKRGKTPLYYDKSI